MKKMLKIDGMMCKHCVAHVTKALNAIPGVTAQVELDQGLAAVETTLPVPDEALVKAIVEAGYQARVLEEH